MTARPISADTTPRYTSYPTAPHFHAGIDGAVVEGWMRAANDRQGVSLYIHIPFCDRLCWFCACHTRHTRRYEPVAAYLKTLHREIALVASKLPSNLRISSVHFGGGSPTMLIPSDLVHLMKVIREAFAFMPGASINIEIDPNDMDDARLDAVAQIGVTRASLGVQDFEPRVQKAINRDQSFEQTEAVVAGLRARGVSAINLDLVYGLPHQTIASVEQTVLRCMDLRPDRFAMFGYAHVPWFKKHQTMINEAWLPGRVERIGQSQRAAELIKAGGYTPVGIDHFALPGDNLASASAAGTLRRNFQGYTEDVCETLVGLGPSSISQYRQGYAQNVLDMGNYMRAVDAGALPIARGISLSLEDKARGWIIERLMCDFEFSIAELADLAPDLAPMLVSQAEAVAKEGHEYLVRDGNSFVIPQGSRSFTRATAARFDAYLGQGSARHSATV